MATEKEGKHVVYSHTIAISPSKSEPSLCDTFVALCRAVDTSTPSPPPGKIPQDCYALARPVSQSAVPSDPPPPL
jgi:hypothetical protein